MHLYVVEDDAALRQMLSGYLLDQGLRSTSMSSAEEMFDQIECQPPDLVVLDIGLPGMSGLEACQRLRQRGDRVGIILVSARNDAVDRILGLETGADDYLNKPFAARELLARARAVLRRGTFALPSDVTTTELIRLGDWSFRPGTRSLHRGDSIRRLNDTEFLLLTELTSHAGQPVTRERLFSALHPDDDTAVVRTVDASIMRLRRLVERDPSNPRCIQTVRNQGYMYLPDESQTRLP